MPAAEHGHELNGRQENGVELACGGCGETELRLQEQQEDGQHRVVSEALTGIGESEGEEACWLIFEHMNLNLIVLQSSGRTGRVSSRLHHVHKYNQLFVFLISFWRKASGCRSSRLFPPDIPCVYFLCTFALVWTITHKDYFNCCSALCRSFPSDSIISGEIFFRGSQRT